MSQKITGKNLHYDDTLPPFLRRLKGQHAGAADAPDPILASRRRAAKPRSASEEAEGAPLVVDEDGNAVAGVTVGADGTVTRREEEDDGAGEADGEGAKEEDKPAVAGERDGVAAIGGSKKRKAGKVVGLDAEDEGEGGGSSGNGRIPTKKGSGAAANKADGGSGDPAGAKKKKKAKKIKLSFGDEDGD